MKFTFMLTVLLTFQNTYALKSDLLVDSGLPSINEFSLIWIQPTDDDLYNSALEMLSLRLYLKAIKYLDNMTDNGKKSRRALSLRANAYIGICGLDLDRIINELDSKISKSTLYATLFNIFPKDLNNIFYCFDAYNILASFGSPKSKSDMENLMSGVIELLFIGSKLGQVADRNNDDRVDVYWDPCDGNGESDLSNDQLDKILMFTLKAYRSFKEVKYLSNFDNKVDKMCMDGMEYGFSNICSVKNEKDITQIMRYYMRIVLREGDNYGLQMCLGDLDFCSIPGCYI